MADTHDPIGALDFVGRSLGVACACYSDGLGGQRLVLGPVDLQAASPVDLPATCLAVGVGAAQCLGLRWRPDQKAGLARAQHPLASDNDVDENAAGSCDGPAWIRTRDRRIMSPLL
jgi:hypothetical protein